MSLLKNKFMPLAALAAFGVAGASVVACGDDDTTVTPTTDAGTATDTGTTADTGTTTDAGKTPVWERLGANDAARYTAVQGLVGKIVAAELGDCQILPYFGAGRLKIKASQLSECLSQQIASALGAPAATATYPTTVLKGTADEYVCRDMKTSHAGQQIPEAVYTKFLQNAVATVKTELASAGTLGDDVVNALAPALLGPIKTDIVDPAGVTLPPASADAGATCK